MVQTEFDEVFGILLTPEYYRPNETVFENSYPDLQCPYCLFTSQSLNDFLVVGKNGRISKKMALCKKCHVSLRRSTLIAVGKMDPIQYAGYLASLANWDVDRKVKWQSIFDTLDENLTYDQKKAFWEEYRRVKGELNPAYKARIEFEQYDRDIAKQAGIEYKVWQTMSDEEKQAAAK